MYLACDAAVSHVTRRVYTFHDGLMCGKTALYVDLGCKCMALWCGWNEGIINKTCYELVTINHVSHETHVWQDCFVDLPHSYQVITTLRHHSRHVQT